MELPAKRIAARVLALGLTFAAALGPAACSSDPIRKGGAESYRESEGQGEPRKRFTGQNFIASTTVEAAPRDSTDSPGWDAERAWSGDDDWEPHVAADPTSPAVYQLATRFRAKSVIAYRRSRDGGATWEPDRPLFDTQANQYDPQVRVAANTGRVFAAWLETPGWRTRLVRSDDRGGTWSDPVDAAPTLSWTDHGWLAVSPDGNHVYIAINSGASYVVASHDGGRTFGPPVRTSFDKRSWLHTGGAVATDGTVYFATCDYSNDYSGPTGINVIRSADGGSTWTSQLIDRSAEAPDCPWAAGCYFGFLAPTAGLAVDAAGRVLVAYNAGLSDGRAQGLYARWSADGLTWSPRVLVSAGPTLEHHAFPAAEAGPTPGDLRIVFQASRRGDPASWNTYYVASNDGGASWSAPVRLSDQPRGAPYKDPQGYDFPYGDYLGYSVGSGGVNHVLWSEGKSYNGPGSAWYTRGR